jgi:hypothetical protein
MDWLARLSIPQDGRFALIRNPDRRDVFRLRIRLLHCLDGDTHLCRPDLVRIVFNPPGVREYLSKFFLSDGTYDTLFIEQNASVARRSGVKRHHVA